MRRCLLLAAISGLAFASLHAQPASSSRPNIVLIITDDVGYGDIGSYGAPDIKTPNIDSLAKTGTRFTQFYANGSSCTPTRAGLISGRYQQRFALERPLRRANSPGRQGGPAGHRPVAAAAARNRGYATALIGKWHLGYLPQFSPKAHGFDSFFGFKSGYIDYYQHTDGFGEPGPVRGRRAGRDADGYMTDLITERSVKFITDHAKSPFFLEVAYNAAHWPYQVARSAVDGASTTRATSLPHDENTGHARGLREDHGARRSGRRPDPRGARSPAVWRRTRW